MVPVEDLRGEGRVIAEPLLGESVVKRLERGLSKCDRGVEGEFGVLFVPDDVVSCRGTRLQKRESLHVVARRVV